MIKRLVYITPLILVIVGLYIHKKSIFEQRAFGWDATFKQVLSDIQRSSINNAFWNDQEWQKYRTDQLTMLPIENKTDFYIKVDKALVNLEDQHSFLIPPGNDGLSCPIASESDRKHYKIEVDTGIGFITLLAHVTSTENASQVLDEQWVTDFQNELHSKKLQVKQGWIIDLTQNCGGNMYPMIAALSIFLQTPNIGGFYNFDQESNGAIEKLTFDGKRFNINEQPIKLSDGSTLEYTRAFPLNTNSLPVIVLIGANTTSSGEFLALMLEQQNNTILIGTDTFGLASANEVKELPQNLGHYALTVGYFLDNEGQPLLAKKVKPFLPFEGSHGALIEYAKEHITHWKKLKS